MAENCRQAGEAAFHDMSREELTTQVRQAIEANALACSGCTLIQPENLDSRLEAETLSHIPVRPRQGLLRALATWLLADCQDQELP